jgi:nucleoside diphosphate kinase
MYEWLIDFMTSWKSYWFIFYWEEAIKKWRELLVEIRDEYLVDRKLARYNMTHASDSIESANKEIMLHFPESKHINK